MVKLAMPFSDPSTYPGHSGVDFGQASGVDILASGPGTVNYAGYLNEKAGYGVTVSYDQYPGVEFMYCHQLSSCARPLAGSRFGNLGHLGSVGSTGHSTGPHVHLEVTIGQGAHTYDGVWLYFDKENWIGKTSPVTDESDDDMKIFSVNGGFYFATSRGIVGIKNPNDLSTLRRFVSSPVGNEASFNPSELTTINDYLHAPVI